MTRVDSPTPPSGQLTTGQFHMTTNYARWREHGTPGWLLIYTLEGAGRFGYERGELRTRKGDLILLKPRTRNDYGLDGALQRWDLLWAYFFPRVDWHALLKWPEVAPGLLLLHLPKGITRTKVRSHLVEAHRLNTVPRRHREMFAMNALEKCLLFCDEVNPLSDQSRMDPRVLLAMNHLCQNSFRSVNLAAVAKQSGISVSRLAHLFRKESGQSPYQFVEAQRMSRACQLLEMTQESMAAIASELGFVDQFHFSHRFKHHLGVSPRSYRQNLQACGTGTKYKTSGEPFPDRSMRSTKSRKYLMHG
jgi:AraC family transcriptional regulator of arabinose operon